MPKVHLPAPSGLQFQGLYFFEAKCFSLCYYEFRDNVMQRLPPRFFTYEKIQEEM